jgi:GTP-binding protein
VFIDQAKIYVKAGDGGRGCQSIYRDKYSRQGVPDGGDGGRGANIILRADRNLFTLLDFKYNRYFRGVNGNHGSGNNKKGKDALDVIIRVPVGTIASDIKTGCVLRDLNTDKDEVIIAAAGRGGLGNQHKRQAMPGEPGEEKELLLDLKLIAHAAIVGFPNAGKSTLVSSISNAHSKVAAYPFTTKSPILGVVKSDNENFTVADIPGLIEGSSCGRGLGDKFLRHIERTKVLIHLLDMSGFEGRDPLEDYKIINKELANYSPAVFKKPQVIAANKMDLDGAAANLKKFKKVVKKKVYPVSALKKEGLEDLIEAVAERL